MSIQTIQGAWQDFPPNAVVSVRATSPFGGSLASGDWFHVLPAESPEVTAWPECRGRRYFSSVESLVADCGEIRVHRHDDPTAAAIIAAWPHRAFFGRPTRQPEPA